MPWYVFALVDQLPAGASGQGLSGRLGVQRVAGALAIVERRADVPPIEFGTLAKHQAVVSRLAGAVPAILPVRFGTLMEREEIDEALKERDEELADAFAAVRNRVQFTWRKGGARREAGGGRWEVGRARREVRGVEKVRSGTEYLRRAANPPLPAPFRSVRAKLGPLAVRARYQPASASVPDSLYHLVDRDTAARYKLIAQKLASARPLQVRGPFPPFAFAPDLL